MSALCSGDGVVNRVSVIQSLFDYELQYCCWVQYENWMKCGLSVYGLCFSVSSMKIDETWYLKERRL